MKLFNTCTTTCLSVLAVLFLCTACTGINEKQLADDPVISTTDNIHQFVMQQRREFFQLKEAYAKRDYSFYLDRMSEIMELVRDELERAEYFQKNNRYYRSGLDFKRWQSAEQAFAASRKILCEMMVATGEVHMINGDKEYAAALFRAVVSGFEPGEDIAVYVDQAHLYVQELKKADLYAQSEVGTNR